MASDDVTPETDSFDAAISALRGFSPSGDEWTDVARLEALVSQLGPGQVDLAAREAMIGVFERHPTASLGSPGPVVHALEKAPLADHVELVTGSLTRNPSGMAAWMAERCLRSAELGEAGRGALIRALQDGLALARDADTRAMIQDALHEHGT